MIVVTGACGFIGSVLIGYLLRNGAAEVVGVDDFSRADKRPNWEDKPWLIPVERDAFFDWLNEHGGNVTCIYHLGARTDTTLFDDALFDRLNVNYTKQVWEWCAKAGVPLVYASSAATYGLGEHGYRDDHDVARDLQPLNPYGWSKQNFDLWALEQDLIPPFWAGIKFFNVYGPNEYHKGRMASVVYHTYRQVHQTGVMKLFKSHRSDIAHGHQSRDFIYVVDAVQVLHFLMETRPNSGLYNLGTGEARSFLDLATQTFLAMDLTPKISFIDTPKDIRDTYQYYTCADMSKLREAGYAKPFTTLEEGVSEYVRNYLSSALIY